ncbi:class I SAM-dependent methyltransferase [Nocardioides mangrovicus]|uniref:Class I SAM-dependent methyltransferase n=2 Tax=Nocardioides mangrovicus TaxID=2478913 RepID=A0A3L8P7V0_9ACTN|nr:class I SAM-dependent methyltransferase [Nocardioides mangrovicus]
MPAGSRVVELGSGTGRDAFWLADQGFKVTGTDYSGAAVKLARARAKERRQAGSSWVGFRAVNFESDHNWLTRGARYAHEPGAKQVYARGLLDALSAGARLNLWRFCAMLGRSGGHTFLEHGVEGEFPRTPLDVDVLSEEIGARGGRIVEAVGSRLDIAWNGDHP